MTNRTLETAFAIIGGGPAGLAAAELLSASGQSVVVFDAMPTLARKLLQAGIGGLNLTNSEPFDAFMTRYGAAAEWLRPALATFTPDDLRQWSAGLGQETFVGTSGRVFPKTMKAAPLLRAWLKRLAGQGVVIKTRHRWLGWTAEGALRFVDALGQESVVKAGATLLALGGASWPRLGATGAWVETLREAGIEVAPLRPANCGFIAPWSAVFAERYAGQPLKPVSARFAGRELRGEIMLTSQGVEGGLIYALSAALRDAIDAQGEAVLRLDLRPSLGMERLATDLAHSHGSQSLSTHLRKAAALSPAAVSLLREVSPGHVLPEGAEALARLIKDVPVRLTRTVGIERAISSAGGIRREEINADFGLKKKPGVFVAGEMADWEAPTGGYLLQACFATGRAAAKGMLAFTSCSSSPTDATA